MSVKRYDVMSYSLDVDGNTGPFVKYEDYAALEARCAALAAEVYDLKHPGTYLPSKRETPALDAFLAEVRASAIDSLVDIKTKQLADMHPDTHAFGATAMSIRSQIDELQVFAAQIRKGVQS